jgi:hypothetical protein
MVGVIVIVKVEDAAEARHPGHGRPRPVMFTCNRIGYREQRAKSSVSQINSCATSVKWETAAHGSTRRGNPNAFGLT